MSLNFETDTFAYRNTYTCKCLHFEAAKYTHTDPRLTLGHDPRSSDNFHCKYYNPELLRIQKLRFLGISRYKFEVRFSINWKLYQGI